MIDIREHLLQKMREKLVSDEGKTKKLKSLLSDGVSFRALRNTFGANLLKAGVSFDMVAQLLRYENITTMLAKPSYYKIPDKAGAFKLTFFVTATAGLLECCTDMADSPAILLT